MRTLWLIWLAGCGLSPERAEDKLGALVVDAVASDEALRHAALRVDAPALGVSGAWTSGVATAADGAEMGADTPFLSASVGKLFTAAAVMALVDEGALRLDDRLDDWLEPSVYGDLPSTGEVGAVTLGALLRHQSGLPDYFEDATVDGSPSVAELMVAEPDRAWTPASLLAYTAAHFGPPEPGFHYADTNYDLLGLVVEAATGEPFHVVVRSRVIDPLGLERTWYHQHEPAPAPIADCWFDDHNVVGTAAMSLDWAGGGLATTSGDLAVFLRSLASGAPVSLDRLGADWTEDALTDGIDYGYGAWRIRPAGLSVLLRGMPELIGVSGVTGSFVYWAPEWDAVISGSFDQVAYQEEHIVFLVSEVLPVLARVE